MCYVMFQNNEDVFGKEIKNQSYEKTCYCLLSISLPCIKEKYYLMDICFINRCLSTYLYIMNKSSYVRVFNSVKRPSVDNQINSADDF